VPDPDGLSASSTHDTKRSEDVRARIHVLSEIPREWRAAVGRWHRGNRRHAAEVDGHPAPDRNDEYLLYQTLIGAWPLAPMGPDEARAFTTRIQEYMLKAAKEAKLNTSWINPNQPYDEALQGFVARILDPAPGNRFLADFGTFQTFVARLGMVNSLAQTLVKITAPGVPDFYQGTELWDFSLVDPDNRRPVDFASRAALLAGLRERIAAGGLAELARELVEHWADGRIKLYTIHRALSHRRQARELYLEGDYVVLPTGGSRGRHLCAYARRWNGQAALTVVPLLTAGLTDHGAHLPLGPEVWGDTWVALPAPLSEGPYVNLFTGAGVALTATGVGPALPLRPGPRR
jgi:(1->4)-alpha-D-glucan 1-alpha-D-glucosylmutase